jgi:phosphate transport system permease protein
MKNEGLPSILVAAVSSLGIFIMLFILYFLVTEGIPVLREASLQKILLGKAWYPTETPPALGMSALIVGSVSVTLLSSLLAIPLSLLVAIFISDVAPSFLRDILKPVLELLSFLPSIVLGFLGMVVLAPWLQERFELLSGLNLLNASILLGIMSIPIIASLAEEALSSVPGELRDALLRALGATRWETIRRVVIRGPDPASSAPAFRRDALPRRDDGRPDGLGGAAIVPESVFDPVRP